MGKGLALLAATGFTLGLGATGAGAQDQGYKTRHVFIVVMDGVRWQETFGDPSHQFIPRLWNDLRPQGCLFTDYHNTGITVTRQGHSTTISGTWQRCANGGARLTMPTLFDYYRDQTGAPAAKCYAIFGKGAYAFAPFSSMPAYGGRFAPTFICGARGTAFNEQTAQGDQGVLAKVLDVMKTDQPDVVFINFGYTDHSGHVAKDISEYQAAVKNCDDEFGKLWDAIQADPYYRDTTTVFFTNDHGRHTRDFHSHGDLCDGCTHIMLLALGPDIKKGATVETRALQVDVAPTAGELLGIQTPLSTGRVLAECLAQPLGLNRKEAVTETARQAVAAEKLADRDQTRAAADDVLARLQPAGVAADLAGEVLARGMLRAARMTGDARYADWARQWVEVHRAEAGAGAVAVAGAILDMPAGPRQGLLPVARAAGDALAGGAAPAFAGMDAREAGLWAGVLLGRLSAETGDGGYGDAGLGLITAALAQPAPGPSTASGARDLLLLAQAAWCYRADAAVGKAYLIALAQALRELKEIGGLWQDPTVSTLSIFAIQAGQEGGLFRGITRNAGRAGAATPALIEGMSAAELGQALGRRAVPNPANARRQLTTLIFSRARQQIAISVELLRWGVAESGAYADGSALAQGAFLLAWEPPAWSYGGDGPWPAAKAPPV